MNASANEIYFFVSTGILVLSLMTGFIVYFVVKYRQRQKWNTAERERIRNEFENLLLKTQLEIREQTLKTISQEIHDNIGQVLSLTKLNLNTMEIGQPEELLSKISDSKKLVSKAIQDLRDLSRSMNTDHIEAMGLIRALEYELEMIRKTGFRTELNVEGAIARMDGQKELILFRIIQEVLNNIIKHSGADAILANLQFTGGQLLIRISDNGRGFDTSPLAAPDNTGFGLGIRNMRNRAKLIGAEFSIDSVIDKGTTVQLSVPIHQPN